MQHETPSTFKSTTCWPSILILSAILFLASGCQTAPPDELATTGPVSRVFATTPEVIWRHLKTVMERYPIEVDNFDDGFFQTSLTKMDDAFIPVSSRTPFRTGMRYFFKVTVVRGEKGGEPAVKVNIEKVVTDKKSFYSAEERVPSDGIEEEILLYRLQRLIDITAAIDRAFEQKKL